MFKSRVCTQTKMFKRRACMQTKMFKSRVCMQTKMFKSRACMQTKMFKSRASMQTKIFKSRACMQTNPQVHLHRLGVTLYWRRPMVSESVAMGCLVVSQSTTHTRHMSSGIPRTFHNPTSPRLRSSCSRRTRRFDSPSQLHIHHCM